LLFLFTCEHDRVRCPLPKALPKPVNMNWLGVLPFFVFALLFLLLPTADLMVGAFQDADGHFTLANLRGLFEANVLDAYWMSIKISAVSAIGGGVLGSLLAGAMLLLFANAFGAVATAYALTGSSLNIVPILLFAQIRGDVLHNPNLGYAMAIGASYFLIPLIATFEFSLRMRRGEYSYHSAKHITNASNPIHSRRASVLAQFCFYFTLYNGTQLKLTEKLS